MRKGILMILSLGVASLPPAARAQQQPLPAQPQSQPQQAQSQKQSQPQHESLAEAARKAREERKNISKPAKVYDNDNISKNASAISVIGEGTGTTSKGEAAALTKEEKGEKKGEKKDEAYWRSRFAKAHAKLKKDQDELEVLQRELGQLQLQYYPDPMKALEQQYARSDINAQNAKIDAKKKEIEQDQQALSDLEDELRRSGGDPGWARE